MTVGYNEIINQRQFGIRGLRWPTEYRYPDRTYANELTIDVGAAMFELRHEKGETDDHTVTWIPDHKVLCCGDLFIWARRTQATRRSCSGTRWNGRPRCAG